MLPVLDTLWWRLTQILARFAVFSIVKLKMVILKTKYDKHINDNERRRRSIKEKEKAKLNRSQIIKNALSNFALNNSSKKIIFTDEGNEFGSEESENHSKNFNGFGKTALFNSSESENEDLEIREKTQFSGRKGLELLNLQSTYGMDERFKIDERFIDGDRDDLNENQNDKESSYKEKAKQLKILESIIGSPVVEPKKEKKANKRTYEMIRYDATKKEHEMYEIKKQLNAESPSVRIKQTYISTKKERKRLKTYNIDSPKPKVSKEKFYEMSNEIRNSLKEKKNVGQFSLLQTYSLNGKEKNEESENKEVELNEDLECDLDGLMEEKNVAMKNEQNISKKIKILSEENMNEKGELAKGIWKESFFFVKGDVRLQELDIFRDICSRWRVHCQTKPKFKNKKGLQFINKKDSAEAADVAKNYDENRRKLREILRLHLKKQMLKKEPFKHKIGGMSKNHLADSKFKNSRTKFNKRNH